MGKRGQGHNPSKRPQPQSGCDGVGQVTASPLFGVSGDGSLRLELKDQFVPFQDRPVLELDKGCRSGH